jgi:hypothetical protein
VRGKLFLSSARHIDRRCANPLVPPARNHADGIGSVHTITSAVVGLVDARPVAFGGVNAMASAQTHFNFLKN